MEEGTPSHGHLPLEIFEIIIDFVAGDKDTRSTLHAISLTCRALLERCRSHIFETIELIPKLPAEISGPVDPTQASSSPLFLFARLLQSNPNIAYYVRNLAYYCRKSDYHHDLLEALPTVFQHLSRVKSLAVYPLFVEPTWMIHLNDEFSPVVWLDGLPENLQKSLESVLYSPCLTTLSLCSVRNFPMPVLASCKHLRSLDLEDITFAPHDTNHITPQDPLLRPHELIINMNSAEAFQALLGTAGPVIDLSQIRFLEVHSDEYEELTIVSHILNQAQGITSYTQTLSLREQYMPRFRHIIDARTLQTLKNFFITLVEDSNIKGPDPIAHLCDIFDEWGGINILERIDIDFEVQFLHTIQSGEVWKRLNVLANQKMFPALRQINIEIYLDISNKAKAQTLKDNLEMQKGNELKELSQHPKIALSFEVMTEIPQPPPWSAFNN